MAECKCGTRTNSPSGVCTVCTVQARVAEKQAVKDKLRKQKAEQKQKGDSNDMEGTCKQCGDLFAPRDGRQKRCDKCTGEIKPPKADAPPPPSYPDPVHDPEPSDQGETSETCETCLHGRICWLALVARDTNYHLVSDGQLRGMCVNYSPRESG